MSGCSARFTTVPRGKVAVPWSVHVVEAPAPIPPLGAQFVDSQIAPAQIVDAQIIDPQTAAAPAAAAPVDQVQPDPAAALSALSFPQGILLDQRAFARGLTSEPVLELAEYELAQSWFGWRVQVPPAAQYLLRDGLARFAVLAAGEAREGEPARRRAIAALIATFDSYRAAAHLPTSASVPAIFPSCPSFLAHRKNAPPARLKPRYFLWPSRSSPASKTFHWPCTVSYRIWPDDPLESRICAPPWRPLRAATWPRCSAPGLAPPISPPIFARGIALHKGSPPGDS